MLLQQARLRETAYFCVIMHVRLAGGGSHGTVRLRGVSLTALNINLMPGCVVTVSMHLACACTNGVLEVSHVTTRLVTANIHTIFKALMIKSTDSPHACRYVFFMLIS